MPPKHRVTFHRLFVLIALSFLMSLAIGVRLAQLQIVEHKRYLAIAKQEQSGYTKLPARRGEILTKDYNSGESFKMATNVSLDTLYVDPSLIKNPNLVTDTLAPLLIDLEEEKKKDQKRLEKLLANNPNSVPPSETTSQLPENLDLLPRLKTDQELFQTFKQSHLAKIGQRIRTQILLEDNLSENDQKAILEYNLPGIEINHDQLYAKPLEIPDKNYVASQLSPFLQIEETRLKNILEGHNRYVILKRRLDPEISNQIKTIIEKDAVGDFFGVRLQEEHYRFYPENNLAAQIIGFVDNNQVGQYGIEETFNHILQGKEGIFRSKRDGSGKLITVGDTTFTPPEDGASVILTIDRSIQLEIEKQIKRAYSEFNADSIQVIVIDSVTGRIMAMAQEPTFNPNQFTKVYEKEEINLTSDEITRIKTVEHGASKQYFLYYNEDTDEKLEIFPTKDENGNTIYKKFKNKLGPSAYRNHIISEPYEPGSVMKVITMAAALNDGDVTPTTIHPYTGPIDVDCKSDGTCEHQIHNSLGRYFPREDMTGVLAHSSNIGISFVAEKLGKQLLYDYLIRFGFNRRSDIELANEHSGTIRWPEKWSQSDHYTAAFGQGLTVTALQMATAFSAIANGGLLMQPLIVDSIVYPNGEITTFEPQIVQRAITPETANTLTSMLVYSTEQGVAKSAQVAKHFVAGKTGTSQRYKNGEPIEGIGTTIGSFVGFGPINHPKFTVLVKVDRPRRPSQWGNTTAAPLFARIAEFLFQYYNIPPDK